MENRRRTGRRLRIHRETLRHLAADELSRAGGGFTLAPVDPLENGDPKSNAWTGREAIAGICTAFN